MEMGSRAAGAFLPFADFDAVGILCEQKQRDEQKVTAHLGHYQFCQKVLYRDLSPDINLDYHKPYISLDCKRENLN